MPTAGMVVLAGGNPRGKAFLEAGAGVSLTWSFSGAGVERTHLPSTLCTIHESQHLEKTQHPRCY
eukprot:scaffold251111_cov32-Tisochrysis_lutea.AAC.1